MFHKYPKLFEDPHIQYPIHDLELDFADYIMQNKKIIANNRVDLAEHADLIIESNMPFTLSPAQKPKYGALLIHGLLDTPFVMKDIGTQLQSQGLLVRSILLPGHGTVPGSLLNVTYEDWLQAVRYGVASLAKEVEHIFLVGFSTGAALSLYYTLQYPERIAGLITVSPAIKINSPIAFALNWHSAVSWAWPRAAWFSINKEIDYTKYCSMPFNAAYQVYRLTQALKKFHSRLLPCPLWMTYSTEDQIICPRAALDYFQGQTHPNNKMILYTSTPEKYSAPNIITRKSIYPEYNILNFSHIALPVALNNPHYGLHGDYSLASHILDNKNHYYYSELDQTQKLMSDLLYKLKLISCQKQRLTLNPDFDFIIKNIGEFIENAFFCSYS